MQAELSIKCRGCNKNLGKVRVDTANDAAESQERINKVILAHRKDCRYYKGA